MTGLSLVAHFMPSAVVAVCPSFLQVVTTLNMMLIQELFKEKVFNRRMLFAAFESGIGKEGVAKFCEVFSMPFNISPDTCYSHEEILSQAFQEETSEQLQKNCAEARKLAMLEEALDDDDDDNVTIVDIPISFDGTWSKRGYTANHCIGFLISAATGRVLDFEVTSKVCQQCTQMKAKLDEAGFNDWYQDHICEGSHI